MKRVIWTLLLVVIALPVCLAQETPAKPETKPETKTEPKPEAKPAETAVPAALPNVDQILDKFVEALGGKAALEKLTSRQSKGNLDIPAMGATGTFTVLAKAPDKHIMIIDMPGFGVIQQAFDGKIGWAQDPMSGMRDLAGSELAAQKRAATFHRELSLKDQYSKIEVKSKEKIGEKDAYLIEATPSEGSAEQMYFDVESGLLTRVVAEQESPQGSTHVEMSLEDYKEVDGVKIPFTIIRVTPQMTIVIKFDEVKHNVEIEDEKFSKPTVQ